MQTLSTQRGLAAVEFTIVVPIMLFLMLATGEFGRMLYQYNILTQCARDAARYLSNHARSGTTELIYLTDSLKDDTDTIFVYGDLSASTPRLPNLDLSTISYSASGDFITVSASYNWQPMFSSTLFSPTGNGGIDLSFAMQTNYTMRAL